jgi:hypothetical protein
MVRHINSFENHFLSSFQGSDIPAPLMPSIMAQAVDLPSPPSFGDGTSKLTQDSSSSEPKLSGSSQSGEKKIPKWLKVGLSMYFYLCVLPLMILIYPYLSQRNNE